MAPALINVNGDHSGEAMVQWKLDRKECVTWEENVHEKNGIEIIAEIANKLVVPTVKCTSRGKRTAPSTDPSVGSQRAIAHECIVIWSVANKRI